MIEVTGLKKSFGQQQVLCGINFSASIETVGLLGVNGAGKTTFLKCILGLLDYEGEIKIDGLEVRQHSLELKQRIGYVPQSFPVWSDLTVKESITFFAELRGVGKERPKELLEKFELSAHINKKIRELSGGMRQKLSIVVALLSDPDLILLDEPTASLDTWAIRDILSILQSWQGKKTLLLSSHRLEEVQAVSDRMVQLKGGVFVQPDLNKLRLPRRGEVIEI